MGSDRPQQIPHKLCGLSELCEIHNPSSLILAKPAENAKDFFAGLSQTLRLNMVTETGLGRPLTILQRRLNKLCALGELCEINNPSLLTLAKLTENAKDSFTDLNQLLWLDMATKQPWIQLVSATRSRAGE